MRSLSREARHERRVQVIRLRKAGLSYELMAGCARDRTACGSATPPAARVDARQTRVPAGRQILPPACGSRVDPSQSRSMRATGSPKAGSLAAVSVRTQLSPRLHTALSCDVLDLAQLSASMGLWRPTCRHVTGLMASTPCSRSLGGRCA